MASQIFNSILVDATRNSIVNNRSMDSTRWLRTAASRVTPTRVSPSRMLSGDATNTTRFENKIRLGHMYMFMYDPKGKKTLPYYDQFPLIFPIGPAPNGFYGINLHYLQPRLRAVLMDRLMDSAMSNEYMDETTKLRISYGILQGASKFRLFEPTVKHYLNRQVQSRFIHITPNEWQMALFLPTERFVGADKKQVWKDSYDQLNQGGSIKL